MTLFAVVWRLDRQWSLFALNSVDKSLCAFGADVGRISFVGVDVHCELETWIHSNEHVAEDELAISGDADAHERFVARAYRRASSGLM